MTTSGGWGLQTGIPSCWTSTDILPFRRHPLSSMIDKGTGLSSYLKREESSIFLWPPTTNNRANNDSRSQTTFPLTFIPFFWNFIVTTLLEMGALNASGSDEENFVHIAWPIFSASCTFTFHQPPD